MALVFLLAVIVGVGYLIGRQTAVPAGLPVVPTVPPATATATRLAASSTPTAAPPSATPRPPTPTVVARAVVRRATPVRHLPASPTLVPTISRPWTATPRTPVPAQPRRGPGGSAGSAADEVVVSRAVVASNSAWTAAMETASSDGLAAIKTGSNLQSALQAVRQLQVHAEHWQITLGALQVLWVHLADGGRAQALVRKVSEHRALYRRGSSTPLLAVDESYTNLYDLRQQNGRWLVALVRPVDSATARRLAAALPASGPLPASTAAPEPTTLATATPVAGATPTALPVAGLTATGAETTVRAFYAAITSRAYAVAYALLSQSLQAQQPGADVWAEQFAHERDARVTAARALLDGPGRAAVALALTTTWTTPEGTTVIRRYTGTWLLRAESGGWRLDSTSLHRVVP